MRVLTGFSADAVLLMADTQDQVTVDRARSLVLHHQERRRVARLRSGPRRDSFLVAHQLLRDALGPTITVGHASSGALTCRRSGRPVGVSIAHCGTTVIVAVRPVGPCGVDVETLFSPQRAELLAPWVLGPEEADEHATPESVTTAWVCKEALAKASGVDLADVWRIPVLRLSADDTLSLGGRPYRVAARRLGGHVVALATCGPQLPDPEVGFIADAASAIARGESCPPHSM